MSSSSVLLGSNSLHIDIILLTFIHLYYDYTYLPDLEFYSEKEKIHTALRLNYSISILVIRTFKNVNFILTSDKLEDSSSF